MGVSTVLRTSNGDGGKEPGIPQNHNPHVVKCRNTLPRVPYLGTMPHLPMSYLFDRPYPFLAFTVAFSIIFASDALFLTLAKGELLQRPQDSGAFSRQPVYVTCILVTILNAPPVFGLIYGFSIFGVYDITTLAPHGPRPRLRDARHGVGAHYTASPSTWCRKNINWDFLHF